MFYSILGLILTAAPLAAVAHSTHSSSTATQNHQTVKTDELKSWYDQKKSMVVLDARTKPYFDGRLLPNAKWVPSDSSDKEIIAAVPSKDNLVVVYCAGAKCPASGWLYDKLHTLGYKNVYEFHEGIDGWTQKGYPTSKQ